VIALLYAGISVTYAEKAGISVIKLKNKGRITGLIIEEDEQGVVVDVGYGTVAISKNEIEAVERPGGEAGGRLESEWRGHMEASTLSEEERKKETEKVRRRIQENRRLKEEALEKARRAEEYRIPFKDSSKITVTAVLNDKVNTRLLVDTGANTVVIPMSVARELAEITAKRSQKVPARLADGSLREGSRILLSSVAVGGARAENVQAVAMEMPHGGGLLGMSFLSRFHVRVDSKKNVLILKEK